MVGVQRGLLILMAAGAIALGPSAPKTSGAGQGLPDEGTPAQSRYQITDKEYYVDAGTLWGLQPGLKATIDSWTNVEGGKKPTVEFHVTDDLGRPLDRKGLLTPGTIAARFVVATWDGHYYTNLIQAASGPSRDNTGTYQDLEVGHYKYTFAKALPAFDNTGPVTLFMGVTRSVTDVLGKNYYVNLTKDFIPSTGAATTNWAVTTTAKCNACHDPIAPHGGNYREIKVCALCHNKNNMVGTIPAGGTEPEEGLPRYNGQFFWHAIHSGNFPEITVITFPQRDDADVTNVTGRSRNCAACHDNSQPAGGVWYTYPSRQACLGCHTNVNFDTGQGHSAQNLPFADDTACATCHPPVGTDEYDTSVQGAHIVPSDSKQLKGLNVTIKSVTNVGFGKKPTVTFRIFENPVRPGDPGTSVPPNTTGLSISLTYNGNTIDYFQQPVSESAVGAAYDAATGIATYTFTKALPANAKGTWAFSAQFRRTVNLVRAVGGTEAFTEGSENPVVYASVDGSPVKERRTAVDLNLCNKCHDRLANLFSHGGQRISIAFCVQCHNANGTDAVRRPADGSANPPEGIGFAHMIHRIHTGEELSNDFSIYGFGGNKANFNEVTYPGDRRNCLACHTNAAAFNIPVQPGALNALTPRDFYSPQGPASAACLGCHDNEDFQAHAFLNTATFPNGTVAEACGACHGANSDLSATKVHAR